MTTSRRDFVGTIASAGAAWLALPWGELKAAGVHAAAVSENAPWMFLTADEARVIEAATAQIMPTDDLPGAREAHVVRFIDRTLATFGKDQQPACRECLTELAAASARYVPGVTDFSALRDEDQLAVLKLFEQSNGDEFGWLRYGTIMGMFANPEYGGNFQKAGWKVLGFEDRFNWTPPFGYYDRG